MVAPATVIGSLFAVGGHNNEFLMVADEGHIVFYSSKTMLKLRTQRVSDARLVGLNAVRYFDPTEGIQHHVHAVDTTGNYYVIDVSTNFIVTTSQIDVTGNLTRKKVGAKPVIGGPRHRGDLSSKDAPIHIQSAQWTVVLDENSVSAADPHNRDAAEFVAGLPPGLKFVILTSSGVYAHYVRDLLTNSFVPYTKVLGTPGSLSGAVMAVGKENGLVLLGQLHRTWLWVTSASSVLAKGMPIRKLVLPHKLMSLAVTPTARQTSFAAGGDRGEIAYYPTANIPINPCHDRPLDNLGNEKEPLRFFSDHWHSTPLQALSFTADGFSLLSAAGERTLLSWSIGGSFTRTKVTSSRREELAEGYLWNTHMSAKLDKKSRFRPKVKKNGEASGVGFLTCDVASIVIPHLHGDGASSALAASSPFAEKLPNCYVVGVTGEVAAMDLREQKVTHVADGIRWSLTTEESSDKADVPRVECIEWMGRPALMVVSPKDSEIRIVDPITQQSLYTHRIRLNMQAAIANAALSVDSASSEGKDPLSAYFVQNKNVIDSGVSRGASGGLVAAVADSGRLFFTCEDFTHIGLDSVLRVWKYNAEKKRHIEVQTIYNPHATSILQMQAATVRIAKKPDADSSSYENVTFLFTMDRLGVKCWRSVELPRHENTSNTAQAQRNFLHLGGLGGAKGEKEADTSLWRVVGTHRCPSGRASVFELSQDGTIIMIADEFVRAYEVPLQDLALAFAPNRKNLGFAVSDWESIFTLTPAAQSQTDDAGDVAESKSPTATSLRFITNTGALPSVFARFEDGSAVCWQADVAARWFIAWSASSGVHSLVDAATDVNGELLLAITKEQKTSSDCVSYSVQQVRISGGDASNPSSQTTELATLPRSYGENAQYVLIGSTPMVVTGGSSSTGAGISTASAVLSGRLMCLDYSGLREVRPSYAYAAKNLSSLPDQKTLPVDSFETNVAATAAASKKDKRIDIFFKSLTTSTSASVSHPAGATEVGEAGGEGGDNAALPTSSMQNLITKVLGNEAYAAPPMGLVLSSLLSVNEGNGQE